MHWKARANIQGGAGGSEGSPMLPDSLNNASQPTASTRDVYYIRTIEPLSTALMFFYMCVCMFVCVCCCICMYNVYTRF